LNASRIPTIAIATSTMKAPGLVSNGLRESARNVPIRPPAAPRVTTPRALTTAGTMTVAAPSSPA